MNTMNAIAAALEKLKEEKFPLWESEVRALKQPGISKDRMIAECQRLKKVQPATGLQFGSLESNLKAFKRNMKEGLDMMSGPNALLLKVVTHVMLVVQPIKQILGYDEADTKRKHAREQILNYFDSLPVAGSGEVRNDIVEAIIATAKVSMDRGFANFAEREPNADGNVDKMITKLHEVGAYAVMKTMQDSGIDLTAYGAPSLSDIIAEIKQEEPRNTDDNDMRTGM